MYYRSYIRFEYICECPEGLGGQNCHVPGCGGNLTSQEMWQLFVVPNVTDTVIGCTWTFNSPPETAVSVIFNEASSFDCSAVFLTFWQGRSLLF